VRTSGVASEVVVDEKGRARGVKYFDEKDRQQYQTADLVVISCSATESARLLLNSKSKLFPNGAGNRNDWVGRNLQGHAYTGAWGIFEEETYDDIGPGASIAASDFNHGNAGLKGGGMLANEFIRLPYLFAGRHAPGEPRWGKSHKDYQRKYYKRTIGVQGPVQEMPVFDARVEVDPAVKDYWGIPVVRLSGRRHPHDLETCRFLSSKAEQWVKEAGAVRTWTSVPGLGLSGGQHRQARAGWATTPRHR
jgi:choline dehydrogenase-like flavoprotein